MHFFLQTIGCRFKTAKRKSSYSRHRHAYYPSSGETELGTAGTQPDKGYPGRRRVNDATWPRLVTGSGLYFLLSLNAGVMPQKIPGSGAAPRK